MDSEQPKCGRVAAKLMYHFGKGHATGFPVVCDNAESQNSVGTESKPC
jgi:hypothetical protein